MAPETAAATLRSLADWLDVADDIIDQAFAEAGQERKHRGDGMQQALRVWAVYLDSHPSVDDDLMALSPVGPDEAGSAS